MTSNLTPCRWIGLPVSNPNTGLGLTAGTFFVAENSRSALSFDAKPSVLLCPGSSFPSGLPIANPPPFFFFILILNPLSSYFPSPLPLPLLNEQNAWASVKHSLRMQGLEISQDVTAQFAVLSNSILTLEKWCWAQPAV